ncbi:hypothetical protein [Mycolicibacterium hodleri]|uniref:Uncharacterized protein n=1 Tax=Mycolicibacterium hodleri TaxID=49897 RepID=A0A502E1Q1_9MYCO|nr:hypothetical protein [Mycolicibacterium hodleri]TPG31645.1 hypothetical protein EAH80_22075 [Mycolicibacterium hodleri]
MSHRPIDMRPAQALISALHGVNVTPPKVLTNIVDGFDILGTPVQPTAEDPGNAIVTAAADGKLNLKTLDAMLATAAAESTANTYRQEFRLRAERKFAHRFYTALLDGAADQILDAIRPQFEAAATELREARDAVDLQTTPRRLLEVIATPEEQTAWKRLPELVRRMTRIAAIAAAFGPHADLPVVDDLSGADGLLRLGWVDDRALMCCSGSAVSATETFRQPDPSWQTSPWLRVPLQLHTIAEAQERYREIAESDWLARNRYSEGSGRLTETGFVPDVRTNPHQQLADAEV